MKKKWSKLQIKMKLSILTDEEEKIFKDDSVKNFVIGQSPLENLRKAAILEYITGARPTVSSLRDNLKDATMERYASLLAIYAVEKHGKGKIERSPDACKSDLIFYVQDHTRCLGIQIKTTSDLRAKYYEDNDSTTYGWDFSAMNKDYSGLLMYMRSLTDGVSWLIPYQIINKYHKCSKLRIPNSGNKTRIKWDDYKIDNKNLASKILEYFNLASEANYLDLTLKDLKTLSTPDCISHQLEHDTRKNVIDVLLKANFKIGRPELENMSYDFILGKLRVQEKICKKSSGGRRVGFNTDMAHKVESKFVPYDEKDFDILIIHCPKPYENIFYFIPTDKLIEHGCVKSQKSLGKVSLRLYPEEIMELGKDRMKEIWTEEFVCYYNDPNLNQKLIALYNKQFQHILAPIKIENPLSWNISCINMTDIVNKYQLERTYPLLNPKFSFLLNKKKILERKLIFMKKSFRLTLYQCHTQLAYEKGDFDYVYCKTPLEYNNIFYMIPAYKLEKYKILKTDNCVGQTGIVLPSSETSICPKSHEWANKFIYYYSDINLKQKLLALFQKYSS